MTRYALLLRGINVGGHNRLPMPLLREIAEGAGMFSPRTYLQSGNLVVDATGPDTAVAGRLREAVAAETGLEIPVLARTGPELAAVLAANPLRTPPDPSRFFVAFCERPVGAALEDLDPAAYAPEEFAAVGREIYSWLPDGMHKARLTAARWETLVRGTVTARNWRTVGMLAEMAG